MSSDRRVLENSVRNALSGKGAHVETTGVFAALNWRVAGARPQGVPHSPYQILRHMTYWQEWVVRWLDGRKPALPARASGSWPGGMAPASRSEWEKAVRQFRRGLSALERGARDADLLSGPGRKSPLEMLQTIGAHNSYHAGQVVVLRQLLGKWPPPSGGLTW
jgi:uncharacterized damage-inducible protein DinB